MNDFYIIATPIGNYGDITLRAINIFKSVDFIVCESEKEYKKLFGMLGIAEKKFIICSEHDENEASDIVLPLLQKGEKGALITDCGVPAFEDPGNILINKIRNNNYKITSVPGANSIMTAISLSPYKIKNFYYAGLLSRENDKRKTELNELIKRKEPILIIEAPFRLRQILDSLKEIKINRDICLFFNLTMEDEIIVWGNINKIIENINRLNIKKGEFILLIK